MVGEAAGEVRGGVSGWQSRARAAWKKGAASACVHQHTQRDGRAARALPTPVKLTKMTRERGGGGGGAHLFPSARLYRGGGWRARRKKAGVPRAAEKKRAKRKGERETAAAAAWTLGGARARAHGQRQRGSVVAPTSDTEETPFFAPGIKLELGAG